MQIELGVHIGNISLLKTLTVFNQSREHVAGCVISFDRVVPLGLCRHGELDIHGCTIDCELAGVILVTGSSGSKIISAINKRCTVGNIVAVDSNCCRNAVCLGESNIISGFLSPVYSYSGILDITTSSGSFVYEDCYNMVLSVVYCCGNVKRTFLECCGSLGCRRLSIANCSNSPVGGIISHVT